MRKTDPDHAAEQTEAARALIESGHPGYHRGIADNILNLSYHNQHKSNHSLALQQAEDALERYTALTDIHGQMRALNVLSLTCYRIADYSLSAEYAIALSDLAQSCDDEYHGAVALRRIGAVYFSTGEYQLALESFTPALAMAREFKDQSLQGAVLLSLTSTYVRLKDYDNALKIGTQALEHSKQAQSQQEIAIILGVLGYTHMFRGAMTRPWPITSKNLSYATRSTVIFCAHTPSAI